MGRAKGSQRAATESAPRRSADTLSVEQQFVADFAAADEAAPRAQCATAVNPFHPDRNEDRVLCDPAVGVAAIFDGMGGEDGGELASRAACGALAGELPYLPGAGEDRSRWLSDAFSAAGNAVRLSRRAYAETAPKQSTTGLIASVQDGELLLAGAGDSRAFRYGDDGLMRLNYEGSARFDDDARKLADRLDAVTSRAQLREDKELRDAWEMRNIIDSDLGDAARPDIERHPVSPGELIVLCSDGVSDNLSREEMQAVVEQTKDGGPQAVARALVEQARLRAESSGHIRAKRDDISAAVLTA